MELITRKAIVKFCTAPSKIIRDGSGAYLYKSSKSDLGSYHNGKRMDAVKKDTVYHAGQFFRIKF